MPAQIRIDPAFGKARDLAGPHLLAQDRKRDAEAFGDHGGVDLNVAVAEFDPPGSQSPQCQFAAPPL